MTAWHTKSAKIHKILTSSDLFSMPMRTATQLKLSTENLSIISKFVINNSAVVFFFCTILWQSSFSWRYQCAVSATLKLKTSFLAYVVSEIWQK